MHIALPNTPTAARSPQRPPAVPVSRRQPLRQARLVHLRQFRPGLLGRRVVVDGAAFDAPAVVGGVDLDDGGVLVVLEGGLEDVLGFGLGLVVVLGDGADVGGLGLGDQAVGAGVGVSDQASAVEGADGADAPRDGGGGAVA